MAVVHTTIASKGLFHYRTSDRGAGWCVRELPLPPNSKGKRVFIRFVAASIVSDVFVNGQHVGQHRGAFSAFCYEITSFLRFDGTDTLRVRVDNSFFQDVAPLEGDAPGRNDKGLVTADRKVRKDAFYFYQANWSSAPMVYASPTAA